MHETAMVGHLLRQLERAAQNAGATRVTAVRVRVGELAGFEPSLLSFAFERLRPGTIAADARLDIEVVPLEARCDSCGRLFRVEEFHFHCPGCASGATRVVSGEELVLESISVAAGEEGSGDQGS